MWTKTAKQLLRLPLRQKIYYSIYKHCSLHKDCWCLIELFFIAQRRHTKKRANWLWGEEGEEEVYAENQRLRNRSIYILHVVWVKYV